MGRKENQISFMKPSSWIDGQAVLEGIVIRSQSEYAIALQTEDRSVIVKKSSYHSLSEQSELLGFPFVRGIVHSIEFLYLGMKTLLYSFSFMVKQAEKEKREWKEWINTGTGRRFTDKKRNVQTPAIRRFKLIVAQTGMAILMLCVFVFTIGLLVPFPMILAEYLTAVGVPMGKPLLESILRLLLFFIYFPVISCEKHIRHMFMYHGAKHKAIHCIENGLPLIIKNVRTQPRKHKQCDMFFLFLVICLSSICFVFVRTDPLWQGIVLRLWLMPLVVAVSYEFAHVINESESKAAEILSYPNLWLQGLTTREPDDTILQVTIQAIEAVFDWRAFPVKMGQPVHTAQMKHNINAEELRTEREDGQEKEAEKTNITGAPDMAWQTIQIHKNESEELLFGEKPAKQMTETERKEKTAETKPAEGIEQTEETAISQETSLSMRTKERLLYSIHGDEAEYNRYKKNRFYEEQSTAACEDALMEEPDDLEDDPILKALDRYFGN